MYICGIDTLFWPSLVKDHEWNPFTYSSLEEYEDDILSDKNDGVDVSEFYSVKVSKNKKWDLIDNDWFNWSEIARWEK